MDYVAWAIMVVWFFLLGVGRLWEETIFTVAGGIVGLVLMVEVLGDSVLFALALFAINAYVIWTAVMSEL